MPELQRPRWSRMPYSRVYVTLFEDYPALEDRPELGGWYLQLQLLADAIWPRHPELPSTLPADVRDALVADGPLILLDRNRYTIRGHEAERHWRAGGWRDASAGVQAPAQVSTRAPTRTRARALPGKTRRDENTTTDSRLVSSESARANGPADTYASWRDPAFWEAPEPDADAPDEPADSGETFSEKARRHGAQGV